MPTNGNDVYSNTSKMYLFTVKEASQYLNLKESRVRWEIFRKRIPIIKIGRSVRLCKIHLDQWIEALRIGGENDAK